MKINRLLKLTVSGVLTAVAWIAAVAPAGAQTTNWIAFNDHRASTAPVANGWAITGPNVSNLDMGAPADSSGPLTDYLTGTPLTATVTFTRTGGPDDFGTVGRPLSTNSPMARLFYGIVDLANDGLVGVRAVPPNTTESFVTLTVGGLNPDKRYVFRGSTARNGGYGTRWSVAMISAEGWSDAHINGNGGPGVLTAVTFPAAGLTAGEAAFNSGGNAEGAVVGWNDIVPFPDGTFTITCKQYTNATPSGMANGPYGYGFSAMMLAEVEIVAPAITSNPVGSTAVEQNRSFSLSVAATGAPLFYQWYKEGVGAIAGATLPTYTVAQAQVSDSGTYYVEVYNSLATQRSSSAQVTVSADTAAPIVEAIFSYPTVDGGGVAVLDQIIVEFSEPVTPESVSSPSIYSVPGGGNPVSVIVTNERSVVLVLGTPLAEDTDYTVTLSGATDSVGNVAGSSSPAFRSWASGVGNGLLMESFPVEDPAITVESILADSDYPNNPDRADTLRAFDSRLVYATDDAREGYGARVRGVFIPPVSGNWVFYARTRQLGVVNLNPNGTSEAGKVEILRQSTENAPYNWDRLTSSPFALRAGRAYFIEGLYKGAVGPDYIKVAARLAGTGVPTPVDSPDTDAPDANALAGAAIGYPLAPRNLGGTLAIAQDLADRTADENNPTTLSVGVSNPSGLPLHYQWFRDGSPISGETKPTYTFLPTVAGDNGGTFSVQVSKYGASVTSRTATLTVVPDVVGPQIVEAFSTNLTDVVVRFNELLEAGSAAEPFSYSILPDNDASAAALQADGRTVIFTPLNPLTAGETYEVWVENVADLANNALSPNPSIVTFVAGTAQPRLEIVRNGNQVVLSWAASSTPSVLEETSALATPVANTVWTAVSAAPTVVRGKNTVSVSAGSGIKIYRLRQ
ncbi:MAG: Ig-like domain-containing protein [Verrucomicrobia bacterium]|nr:Ig-like domain-containing protein [Verrucomicrobiota bacterium]